MKASHLVLNVCAETGSGQSASFVLPMGSGDQFTLMFWVDTVTLTPSTWDYWPLPAWSVLWSR